MTEYTSLKASRRLADAGFREESDMGVYGCGGDTYFPITNAVDWSHATRAYRSDTLLEWLITNDWDISIGMPHNKILVDAASMKLNKRIPIEADTIPDALAEVVMKIMENK